MADLVRRPALAGRQPLDANGWHVRVRYDLGAHLITGSDLGDTAGLVRIGPRDWLMVEEAGGDADARLERLAEGRTALAQDMRSAFVFIDIGGAGTMDMLGLSRTAFERGDAFTTRVADLRVTVFPLRDSGTDVRLMVERPSADYLWEWLANRISLPHAP